MLDRVSCSFIVSILSAKKTKDVYVWCTLFCIFFEGSLFVGNGSFESSFPFCGHFSPERELLSPLPCSHIGFPLGLV